MNCVEKIFFEPTCAAFFIYVIIILYKEITGIERSVIMVGIYRQGLVGGRTVYFKYGVEPFVQMCLKILNDREGIDRLHKEEGDEIRTEWEEYHKAFPDEPVYYDNSRPYYLNEIRPPEG